MLPGPTELIIILIIFLVVFGAGKLPALGDSLGRGIQNFRKAMKGQNEIDVTPKETKVIEGEEESKPKELPKKDE